MSVQRLVVDQATAVRMFEKACPWADPTTCNGEHCDCTMKVGWVAGPIVCGACNGSGRQPLASYSTELIGRPTSFRCPRCEGRGYPAQLEIVSESWVPPRSDGSDQTVTVHGVVALDPPTPVVPRSGFKYRAGVITVSERETRHWTPKERTPDSRIPNQAGLNNAIITDRLSGPVKPGSTAHHTTVVTS